MFISQFPLWMCYRTVQTKRHLIWNLLISSLPELIQNRPLTRRKSLSGSSRVHKCKAAVTRTVKWARCHRRTKGVFLLQKNLTWASLGWTDPADLRDRRAGTRSGPVCRRLSGKRSHYPADPNDTKAALQRVIRLFRFRRLLLCIIFELDWQLLWW